MSNKWQKASQCGIVKTDNNRIRVHHELHDYQDMLVLENVKDARWAGSNLIVTLESGKVYQYSDYGQYRVV